jgi:hypothetical protein
VIPAILVVEHKCGLMQEKEKVVERMGGNFRHYTKKKKSRLAESLILIRTLDRRRHIYMASDKRRF